MTPLQIEIMLHYYSCITDYRHGSGYDVSPAAHESIDGFIKNEMLRRKLLSPPVYEITLRGKAYVEALMNMSLPEYVHRTGDFFEYFPPEEIDPDLSEKIEKGAFTDCIAKAKTDRRKINTDNGIDYRTLNDYLSHLLERIHIDSQMKYEI